jgi:UbiD family decarboxylase
MDRQSLRHFVAAYEAAFPQEVVRIPDTVSLEHDVMAVVLEYERRRRIKPVVVADPPSRARVQRGADVDLGSLPIPEYFPGDAGRYLTAGMLVARDPDTGVETEGYHRFQVKGRTKMGVSLHSRRLHRLAPPRGSRARMSSACTERGRIR